MELLEIFNPWWKEKTISKELALPYKRKAFAQVRQLLTKRQITILSGLRRVGKSTMLFQLIEELLKANVRSENILYFSCDEKIEDLLKILDSYADLTKVTWRKEKCFMILDEVQKLPDWSNKIKILYDNFPNIKFVVSGSSSFQLEKEAKINLAGRHFTIEVAPLSFREYLELRQSKIELHKEELWQKEIRNEFERYLLRPFPEIINFDEMYLVKSYIKDNIIEKVLRVDLSEKFKDVHEGLLTNLIELFYGKPGMYINFDEIAKELKISKKTLIKHVYYLEFARVIRRVKNFRPGIRASSRKLQKIYPSHWALGFGWNGKINSEAIVASVIDAEYYWRDKEKEIDFLDTVKNVLPIEVKEASKLNTGDLAHLFFFAKKYSLHDAIVVYNGDYEVTQDAITIRKVPFWKFCVERQEEK